MNVKLEGLNPYLAHFRAPPRDRYGEGRSRRDTVPLESHAETTVGPKRVDPLTVLQKQNLDQNRVQQLIPLRFGRTSYHSGTESDAAGRLCGIVRKDAGILPCPIG
jgi:hypothetical protein